MEDTRRERGESKEVEDAGKERVQGRVRIQGGIGMDGEDTGRDWDGWGGYRKGE